MRQGRQAAAYPSRNARSAPEFKEKNPVRKKGSWSTQGSANVASIYRNESGGSVWGQAREEYKEPLAHAHCIQGGEIILASWVVAVPPGWVVDGMWRGGGRACRAGHQKKEKEKG